MEFLPHHQFQERVKKYGGDYKVQKFTCMDQFLCMAFAQLTYRESLRDTVSCLSAMEKKLYHMGIRVAPTRNNLAHANSSRDWRIFQDFAMVLVRKAVKMYESTPLDSEYDLKQMVYALDSTTIDICLSLFPWARFRQRKGAVKLHTLLELRSAMPTIIYVTDGKTHDVKFLDCLPLEPGAIYVMDRAYVDYGRLWRFSEAQAIYVTRAKKGFQFKRVGSFPKDKSKGVMADQIVELTGYAVKKKHPGRLRRVSFKDLETGKRFVFITNDFQLPADTIAFLYRCRWRIEVFFRWIKQNLRIKSFFGNSENAVKTQIWIAVATYALVAIAKKQLALQESLSALLQILSIVIFEKTPVHQILTSDFQNSSEGDNCKQLMLF